MPQDSSFTIKNLIVKKRGITILKQKYFVWPKKSLCLLTGDNGSGKTTLLRVLTSRAHYEGSISHSYKNIVYMPVDYWNDLPDTVTTNDLLALFNHHSIKVPSFFNKSISNLSSGEKQVAGCYYSVIQKPDCLICDEPFAHLDTATRYYLISFLKNISKQINVIVSGHLSASWFKEFSLVLHLDNKSLHVCSADNTDCNNIQV